MEHNDVVIVGGGLAGLSAAAYLSFSPGIGAMGKGNYRNCPFPVHMGYANSC